MSALRVLQVVPTYYPATRYGGPIESVHGLGRALVEAGHEVSVYTTNVDGPGVSDVPLERPVSLDGVRVTYFGVSAPRRLYRSPTLGERVRATAREFDLVHVHSVFLWPTLVAARAAAGARVPYIVTPRGMLDPVLIAARGALRKRAWIALFERRTLAGAAVIHVTADLEAEALRALRLDVAPVRVVPNGVRLPPRGGARPPRTPGRLLFVGRLTAKKGLDVLIAAMAGLPGVDLDVAGPDEDGYRAQMEGLAARHGVRDRVHFLGLVNAEARDDLMRRAALLVLPSRSENFANVATEAMALGCPVLLSPHVGVARTAEHGGAGAIAEVSADAVRDSIAGLLASPGQLAVMGERGRALAREQFGWPAVAARMEDLYMEAMAGAGVSHTCATEEVGNAR